VFARLRIRFVRANSPNTRRYQGRVGLLDHLALEPVGGAANASRSTDVPVRSVLNSPARAPARYEPTRRRSPVPAAGPRRRHHPARRIDMTRPCRSIRSASPGTITASRPLSAGKSPRPLTKTRTRRGTLTKADLFHASSQLPYESLPG